MKFDVVIGNPPYQDPIATSSKKLWDKFVLKGIEHTNKNGFLAMITPSSWMGGQSEVFELMKDKQPLVFCPDGSQHFPNVGTTISYYIIKNCKNTLPTITTNGSMIDFKSVSFIPKSCNKNAISILEKVISTDKLDVNYDSFCHSQRQDKVRKKQDGEFIYPNKHGSNTLLYSNVKHPAMDLQKVMFYMSGRMKPFYDNGEHGISQHHGYVPVNNKIEADNLIKYLRSKIISFLIQESTFAQAWNKKFIKTIPMIDLSKSWTDSELYQHFNLTQEEIDYIEQTVKYGA